MGLGLLLCAAGPRATVGSRSAVSLGSGSRAEGEVSAEFSTVWGLLCRDLVS